MSYIFDCARKLRKILTPFQLLVLDSTVYPGATDADPDSDADGLPDQWEIANGLDVGENDALADADRDGTSNLLEYLADTMSIDSTRILLGGFGQGGALALAAARCVLFASLQHPLERVGELDITDGRQLVR